MLDGLVMVIMAIDHVRFFMLRDAMLYDATNLDEVSPAVFLTRFVTHVCAPFFLFLAGSAAFLYGQSRTSSQLSRFLFIRGIWLIIIKFSLINFIWYLNPAFNSIYFGVIWAIGASMLVLAMLFFFALFFNKLRNP